MTSLCLKPTLAIVANNNSYISILHDIIHYVKSITFLDKRQLPVANALPIRPN